MRLPWLLFALLLAMCLVGAWLILQPAPPAAAGYDHPEYATMQRGGDGEARHSGVLTAGWLLGVLEISFFVGLLALGVRRDGSHGERQPAALLLVGFVLFAATFTGLVWAYAAYAASSDRPLVLSFPVPSAWMLYGIWIVPVYFLVLYVLRFERLVLSDEDVETFRQIVARRRQREP